MSPLSGRIVFLTLGILFAIVPHPLRGQSPGAPLNVRMQRVLMTFVEQTGHKVLGVGSWIGGTTFNTATSDFDMRLIIDDPTAGPDRQRLQWREAKAKLARLVEAEFGGDAGNVLGRTNLYPPNQMMQGVEDAADAHARFVKLNTVPALSFTGSVTEKTPTAFTEGLYGAGARTYVEGYERKSGRLFYVNQGKAVTGLSELAHLGEEGGIYTAAGTASTASQWAEHAMGELQAGRGDKVAKYLERLERDLAKSRSLGGLGVDEAFRAEVLRLRDLLKTSPGRLASVGPEVTRLLSRAHAEAAILGAMDKAGAMQRGYLRVMLSSVVARNKLGFLIDQAVSKVPSWADAGRAMQFLSLAVGAKATAQSLGAGEDPFRTLAAALGAADLLTAIGPGLLLEMTAQIISEARAGGLEMAASFQDAWDLMQGIYSAWGHADTDPDKRRSLTLKDLVERFKYEEQVAALVQAQAARAATTGLGTSREQPDPDLAQAIFARCWPVVRDAWRWERDRLTGEYLTLASGVTHAPLTLYYAPVAPRVGQLVTLEAASADRQLNDRLVRMREVIATLYGAKSGVVATYSWAPTSGATGARDYERVYSWPQSGTYTVTVRLQLKPFTSHTQPEPRVMLARDLPALVDVVVGDADSARPAPPATTSAPTAAPPPPAPPPPAAAAWQLVEVVDYAKSPTDAAYRLAYGRGSITLSWALGDDAWTMKCGWSEPPKTIVPGERVTMEFFAATTQDVGDYYSAGGGCSMFFDKPDVEPGSVIAPVAFTNDKGESANVDLRHRVKTPDVSRTVWAQLPAGRPGARMALLVHAFNGRGAGTKYLYEWKGPAAK